MNLKRTANRVKRILTGTPVHVIILKIFKKPIAWITDFFRYRYALRDKRHMHDKVFIKKLGFKNFNGEIDNILSEKLKIRQTLEMLLSKEDLDFITVSISAETKYSIIKSANDICLHRFNLLGSGSVQVSYDLDFPGLEDIRYRYDKKSDEAKSIRGKINGEVIALNVKARIDYEPINWHVDFKSGYIWNKNTWYKKIKTGGHPGADIKVPWELSRFHHLVTLGQAYSLTKNERYTIEYIYQVVDWIENNKPQFGVNWKCTMDVAIRAANIVQGLVFFKDSRLMTPEFLFYLLKSLYIHGCHIIDNLEYSSITSNHYLSDIAGLVLISGILKSSPAGRKWEDFAIRELKKEMPKQVYADGADFEASTCYHRLVLELFFYPTLFIIKTSGIMEGMNYIRAGKAIFGNHYIERLFKMFAFVFYISKTNNRIPQIGDNDNGRFFIFAERNVLDTGYLLLFASIFFKNYRFKTKGCDYYHEALWVFGRQGYFRCRQLDINDNTGIASKSFENAGIYVMRKDNNYLIASCGTNGQNGNGGHAHNDKLSFELFLNGEDIIMDTGTYLYTPFPVIRNDFRSASLHNTVSVDKMEQNRFMESNIFSLENDARIKVNQWITNEEYDYLDAEHYGYMRLKDGVIHRRKIFFSKNNFFLVIKDIFTGKGEHSFDTYFNLSPEVDCGTDGKPVVVNIRGKNTELKIIPVIKNKDGVSLEDSWISGSYGNKVRTKKIIYSMSAKVPVESMFVFMENKSSDSLSVIKRKVKDII